MAAFRATGWWLLQARSIILVLLARTVRDAALLLQTIAGRDEMDATSAFAPVPDYVAALDGNVKGAKIGLPKEYFEGLSSESGDLIMKGVGTLKGLGCEVHEISLPATKYAIACYYIIATAEASSNLARYDGVRYTMRAAKSDTLSDMYRRTRGEGFGAECKRRIMLGTYVLSHGYYDAFYLKAQKVRALIAEDYKKAFSEVDAIVAPVAPFAGFQDRRKSRRSARDVSFRYLHHYRRPGRHSLHERPLWNDGRRTAGRHADSDQTLRRGRHVPPRRRFRESHPITRLRGDQHGVYTT